MTEFDKHLAHYRDQTDPTTESLKRTAARIRTTLADERSTASLLRELPEPSPGALFRVRRRLLGSVGDPARANSAAPTFKLGWPVLGGLGTAMAAAAAVLILIQPSDPTGLPLEPLPAGDTQPELAQLPTERPTEAPEASTQTRRQPMPPPVQVETRKHPSRKAGPGVAIADLRSYGQVDSLTAQDTLAMLKEGLGECLQKSGASDSLEVSIAIEVDGIPKAVRVVGNPPGAKRFERCVEPLLLAAKFGTAPTLRAGIEKSVTGGVLRFQIQTEAK